MKIFFSEENLQRGDFRVNVVRPFFGVPDMKYRQEHKDAVADAIQRTGLAPAGVTKVLTLIDAIMSHGDNAGTVAESLTKAATPAKVETPAS
jgi:hypothetical protein